MYDEEGRWVRTLVMREPEWSEEDRARVLAFVEWERGFCPCGCGIRIEDAYNPDQAFMVHDAKCRARVALEKVKRADKAKAEKASPNGKLPEGWDDGRRYYVVKADTPPEAAVPVRERAMRQRQAREVSNAG